jgi:beta-fructofuranosidase
MPNSNPVPRQTFSSELAVQEQELKKNELLERFAVSRAAFEQDPYRPSYHFCAPETGLNDPNGLCYWKNNWHLFYQGYPAEGRVHWGHAVSTDLVHWRDLPYAIYPDKEQDAFSGTCFVEDDRVIALYYGHKGTAGLYAAVADDPLLLNWEQLGGGPVIPNVDYDERGFPHQVYDPCLWKEGDFYYALCGGWADGVNPLAGPHGALAGETGDSGLVRPVDHLYRSPNLIDWIYIGEFVENNPFGFSGDDGSCPHFWPIADKHILLTYSHVHSAMFIIGEYDAKRQKLVACRGGNLNTGASGKGSIHAPSAYPDGKGGVNCIYNITEGKPQKGWAQIMSLPRKYTLGANNRLLVEPAGDIASIREDKREITDLELPANSEVVLEAIRGNTLEIQAEIDLGESKYIRLNVLRSTDKSEYTAINFYREGGVCFANDNFGNRDSLVIIDPGFSSTAGDVEPQTPQQCSFHLEKGEPLELRVFIDRSVVEVFVNNTSACLTRVYPEDPDSLGVSLYSRGRPATCRRITAWKMKRISP